MQISANMQTYMCACACVCAVYVSDYEITISSTHTLPSTLGVGCIVPIFMLCCRSHKRKVSMFMANKMFFQQFNEADIYFFFVRTVAMLTKIVAGDKSAQIDKSHSHACIPIRISQRKCTYAKLPQSMCSTI